MKDAKEILNYKKGDLTMNNNSFTYSLYRGCKDIITIDLHNRYTIIAIKTWNHDKKCYMVEFRLTKDNVDRWDLIEESETVKFNSNYKTINLGILKYVSNKMKIGFYDFYFKRFDYELKCFEVGNDIEEEKRLCLNAN